MNNQHIIQLRQELDILDVQLLDTLEKRFKICKQIGKHKKQNHLSIEDLEREKQVIKNKTQQSNLDPEFAKEIFQTIFKQSKKIQNES